MENTVITVREYLGEEYVLQIYFKVLPKALAYIEDTVGTVEAERIVAQSFERAMNRLADAERIVQMPKSVWGWCRFLMKDAEFGVKHYLALKRSRTESIDAALDDEESDRHQIVERALSSEPPRLLGELTDEHRAVWPTVKAVFDEMKAGKTTRVAFVRRVCRQDDYGVIARDLGLTVNNCYQKVDRVLRRLRELGPKIYERNVHALAA